MKGFQFSAWQVFSSLLLTVGTVLATPAAQAADTLVISYGPLNATVGIADLEALVETGETSADLQFYLNLAGIDPNLIRDVLQMELGANTDFMEDLLSSDSGSQLLAELSEIIHLPPNRPDVQVLKSADQRYRDPSDSENQAALKLALMKAVDDRQLTILEVLKYYPTQRVYLDAAKLIELADSLQAEPEPSN